MKERIKTILAITFLGSIAMGIIYLITKIIILALNGDQLAITCLVICAFFLLPIPLILVFILIQESISYLINK